MATGDKLVTLDELKLVNDRIKVTGVKGNAESTYRAGDVNLTPTNIGAVNKSGDTMTGDLYVTQDTGRVYLGLTTKSDQAADLRFSNENSAKWAISSRSSSDNNFLGLYNHMANNYAIRVTNDSVVNLLNPLPVGSGGTGATTAAAARTSLGITPANIGAMAASPGSIELNPGSSQSHGGFIDFHYAGSSADYTSRIIESASGRLNIPGELTLGTPLGIASGGTGARSEEDMHTAVFNNTRTSAWTSYPTAAGLYRTVGTLWSGLPSGASAYGVLAIMGCGTYYMHLYADASGDLYYGEKGSAGAPTSWRKVMPNGTAISSSAVVAASISLDLSAYTRIECDFQCPGGSIHLCLPRKNVYYIATGLNENITTATNYNIYGIKIKFTNSGFELDYCGYKNMNTGAWNDRFGNSGYTLQNIHGYTWN